MAWSNWESLGGIITAGPAVSSWAGERLDTFVKGSDNALWHQWFDGGWSGWESLGGVIDGSPCAVSWASGRIDVFARGMDNALWHKWFDGGWSGWESLGGTITAGPAVCSWAPGRLDVFAKGSDNALWHKWFDNGWSGWESLGGVIDNEPGAVSWQRGRIDVFARGMDNALWHKWFDGGWSGWESLGGVITAGPAASSWGPGRLDIFVKGSDNALWHKWFDGGWSGWESLGGVIDNTPAVVSWSLGRIDVFARGMDNAMWHKWWTQRLPTVRLHVKVLTQPTRFSIDRMIDNMIDLYATSGIRVHRVGDQNLNLPLLNDLDVGACVMGTVTAEQTTLMANRAGAGADDVVVYFVRSTNPGSNGCAAHPANRPAAVVASVASEWTLAHEVGHVLGLAHVTPTDRLMMDGGTNNITNPPPDLIASEAQTMDNSPFTQNLG
ncbi:MAG: hypothetical protein H8K04_02835 [Nitrospira sp.]